MENIDLFDRYFRKDMSDEEIASFEERLSNDPAFLSEYDEYVLLIIGLRFSRQEELYQQMDSLEDGLKRKNKVRILSLIGSAAAVLIGALFLFKPFPNNINQDVYDQYYDYYSPHVLQIETLKNYLL